jgi:fido (protein-threonine AMPylation protein)
MNTRFTQTMLTFLKKAEQRFGKLNYQLPERAGNGLKSRIFITAGERSVCLRENWKS